MIKTRKELLFFLKADRMMNRGSFTPSLYDRIRDVIVPDYTMRFLSAMRYVSYYSNRKGLIVLYLFWLWRYRRVSLKMGFSIGACVFGYGLVIPHYGTIVVGGSNKVGNYAVLHTSTCIVSKQSVIGDGLYLSVGAIISDHVDLGNNVTIGANSLVNKSIDCDNVLMVGIPAKVKKESEPWYIRDGVLFQDRVAKVEILKSQLGL